METTEPISVVHPRCCGVDVHKRTVQACVLISLPNGHVQQEQRSFTTMSEDLLTLLAWLVQLGCTHVAMESTGVYWKPLYNLLDGHLAVLVVNAQHIKQVPGRKTDVADAAWIAGLLRHGLLRPSFIPDRAQRELRELTRYRMSLVEERSAEVNRLQKVLEGANIKAAGVATDILGVSGREMLDRLVAGETDAVALAQSARGRMKAKIPQLEQALAGTFGPHQRFLVARQLAHIDYLDQVIADLNAEIAQRLAPFQEEIVLLDTLPGVGVQTAEALIAEIGVDMGQFPSADHLASWAGLVPGNNESAGKRKSGKSRKGSRWLRASLVVAAKGAARTRDSRLRDRYHAIKARRGAKRATVAIAHSLLIAAYHVLTDHVPYDEGLLRHCHRQPPIPPSLPPTPDDLLAQLRQLGYEVTIHTAPSAA